MSAEQGSSRAPLVVHIVYALDTGGLENGLVNLINRTPVERYRHAIICLTKSGQFAQRITTPDVAIYELQQRPGLDWRLYGRLWKLLKHLRPALVHTRNLATLEMHWVVSCFPGVKRLHGEHGRDVGDLAGLNIKYLYWRRLMRLVVQHYICVSQDLERWMLEDVRVARGRLTQIYNGVDQTLFQPELDAHCETELNAPEGFFCENQWVVGTVGRLAEVKNQRSLLLAFRAIFDDRPELKESWRLIIVGDGPLNDVLAREVVELGLSHNVWLAGDRSDVSRLLNRLHVFVLPSLAEGISNTLLEAMACRLPVVVTAVGGNTELVKNGYNGVLVEVNKPLELAQALLELMNDPCLCRDMGQAGKERVKKGFLWHRALDSYLSVYDKLLAQKPI